jgi:hypothetical protein
VPELGGIHKVQLLRKAEPVDQLGELLRVEAQPPRAPGKGRDLGQVLAQPLDLEALDLLWLFEHLDDEIELLLGQLPRHARIALQQARFEQLERAVGLVSVAKGAVAALLALRAMRPQALDDRKRQHDLQGDGLAWHGG